MNLRLVSSNSIMRKLETILNNPSFAKPIQVKAYEVLMKILEENARENLDKSVMDVIFALFCPTTKV
jgi:hypothetical protein